MDSGREERFYPTRPLVGVGGVVWDGQRILLERRGKPPAQGLWALPGGLIELGETATAALRREIREECGIEVEVGPILGLFEPIQRDPDNRVQYHFVVVDFLVYYAGGELTVGDDAAEARWVTPEELPQYELNAAARAMIRRALDMAARRGSPDDQTDS